MKIILIIITLLFSSYLLADEVMINNSGETILLKDDFTWEYIESIPEIAEEALLEINYQGITITVEEVRIITTYSGQEAGLRFHIKNNSSNTVTKLKITVYFLDKTGLAFFEKSYIVVNEDSWTNPIILKPNYTVLHPSDNDRYSTAEGIDLDEWDEGQIWFEVTEIEYAENE